MKKLLKNVLSILPLAIFMAVLLVGCQDEDNGIIGSCPIVVSTNPLDNANSVPLNQIVSATFNEALNPASIDQGSLVLTNGGPSGARSSELSGMVSYNEETFTISFTPSENLTANTNITAVIPVSVKDPMGNALQAPYTWTFSTGTYPDVISTIPADQEAEVSISQVLSATFSEAMDPSTINTTSFTLMEGTNPVAGLVSYSGSTATFTPGSNLLSGNTYSATITTIAENANGVALQNDYIWTFNTEGAPTVISTVPVDLASDVSLNQELSATFSGAMNPSTINTSSFTLMEGTNPVAGLVNYSGNTATFTPNSNLLSGNTYTATITTMAQNTNGVALENDFVWSFSTLAPGGPVAVNLRSLDDFGIIAGVGVSNNAGPSEIHDMNVGIYPGVRSSITGFFDVDGGPGLIFNGSFMASDDGPVINAALNQAKLDLVDAYNEAAGATLPAPAIAPADLGGKTLAPGIYTSASTMLLQNGDLTLDAQGDSNASWIFQVGSDFTSIGGAGGNVILSGGAKAKNVFWQVSSSATIGDGTIFKGNVLAFSSITMNSGAVAEGRMLARNGSVVLTSSNTITRPVD